MSQTVVAPRPVTDVAPPAVPPDAGRTPAPGGPALHTVVLVPTALTLLLGLWGVRRQDSMWRDESVTYQVAHRSLSEICRLLGNVDAVHGLYYLLMHTVFRVWDGGLLALRLPSVLAMTVTAGLVGLLGHRLAGPRAGLAAALVFAVSPTTQYYAQEGRSYALVCALVAWSSLLLCAAAEDRCRPGTWTAYAAVQLTACLLHEFAVLALLAHGVTLLTAGAARPVWRHWAGAGVVVALGLLPLAVLSQRQSAQVDWISPPGWGVLLGLAAGALPTAACTAHLVRRPTPGAVRLTRYAGPLLIVPPAALLLLSFWHPLFVGRYVLYSTIGGALLLGAALESVLPPAAACPAPRSPRGVLRAAAVPVTALTALAVSVPWQVHLRSPESRKDDVVAAARAVRELGRPGDGVLFLPQRRRDAQRVLPRAFRGLTDLALDRTAAASATLYGTEVSAPRLHARLLTVDRVVTVTDPPGEPVDTTPEERLKRRVLARDFHRCATRRVPGLVVSLWARSRGGC